MQNSIAGKSIKQLENLYKKFRKNLKKNDEILKNKEKNLFPKNILSQEDFQRIN